MKNFLKKFQTIMYECFILRILTFTRFALSICFIERLSHIVDKPLRWRDIEIFQSVSLRRCGESIQRHFTSRMSSRHNSVVIREIISHAKRREVPVERALPERNPFATPLGVPWSFDGSWTVLEKLSRGIDQGRGLSSPHPLRRSSDWMPM